MKYIRTEYGHIYEYVEIRIHTCQYHKFGLYRHNLNSEYEQIIAQADTIEALCDRFVFIDKKYRQEKNRYQVYTRLFEKKNLPKYIQNGTEIYGAIWCEWGLKYVAKLDDKGEWHLL
jgi:hypothetical protein